MARSLRESRFRRHGDIGEDVNPAAYLANLADCMLVLACGFLVALISYWNIDIAHVSEFDETNMEQVDPEVMDAQDLTDGSYYVEAGKVYQDPNTGTYYMLEETDGEDGDADSSSASSAKGDADGDKSDGSSAGSASSASSGNSSSGSVSDEDIVKSRAMGAD